MLVLGLAVALSVQVGRRAARAVGALHSGRSGDAGDRLAVLVPVLSVAVRDHLDRRRHPVALGADGIPISPYITTISFTIYAVCRVIGPCAPAAAAAGADDATPTARSPSDLG